MFGNFSQLLSLSLDDLQDQEQKQSADAAAATANATSAVASESSRAVQDSSDSISAAGKDKNNTGHAENSSAALESAMDTIRALHAKLTEMRAVNAETKQKAEKDIADKESRIAGLESQVRALERKNKGLEEENVLRSQQVQELTAALEATRRRNPPTSEDAAEDSVMISKQSSPPQSPSAAEIPDVAESQGADAPVADVAASSAAEEDAATASEADAAPGPAPVAISYPDLSGEVAALKEELDTSSKALESLQEKYGTVCEKFKETVRKLAETKGKFRSYDEEILQYRDALNSKEMSFLTVQERCTLLEKQSAQKEETIADCKTLVAELKAAATVSENTVTGLRSALAAAEGRVGELELAASGKADTQRAAVSELQATLRDLEQQNEHLQGRLNELQAAAARSKEDAEAKDAALVEVKAALDAAQDELERSREGARRGEDAGQQLADYKKRAQLALKQAAAAAQEAAAAAQAEHSRREATLQDEITELRRENGVLQADLRRAKEATATAKTEAAASAAAAAAKIAEAMAASASTTAPVPPTTVAEGAEQPDQHAGEEPLAAEQRSETVGDDDMGEEKLGAADSDDAPKFVIGGEEDSEEESEEMAAQAEARRLAEDTVAKAEQGERLAAAHGAPQLWERPPSQDTWGAGEAAPMTPTPSSDGLRSGSSGPGSAVQPGQLYMVYQLQQQLQSMRSDYIARGLQLDDMQRLLLQERHDKEAQLAKNAELSAFLGRLKAQMQQMDNNKPNGSEAKNLSGDSSAAGARKAAPTLNLEYLKHCVFRFMKTKAGSEKHRLAPVIATILQFTPTELEEIQQTMLALYGADTAAAGSHGRTRRGQQQSAAGGSGIEDVASEAFSSLYESVFGSGGTSGGRS